MSHVEVMTYDVYRFSKTFMQARSMGVSSWILVERSNRVTKSNNVVILIHDTLALFHEFVEPHVLHC